MSRVTISFLRDLIYCCAFAGSRSFDFRYSTIWTTASSTLTLSDRMWISGLCGASYGAEMPVKSLISPARAFL